MTAIIEGLMPPKVRLRGPGDLREDLALLRAGVLDLRSLVSGHTAHANPVAIEVRGADGRLKARRYTRNLRTNAGGSWQANAMAGGVAIGSYCTGTSTSIATTSLTDTSATFPTAGTGLAGQVVVTGATYGVIVSNTSTVLTIDKWYAPATPGGSAASNPSTGTFVIVPCGAPAWWFCLSSDTTAPNTTDTVVASEITTNGLARSFAGGPYSSPDGYQLTAPSGSGSSTNTFSYSLSYMWTASGTQSAVQKAGMLTAATATGAGILVFENTFSSVNLISSDTLTLTWTITG